jgi:hypothetical protein
LSIFDARSLSPVLGRHAGDERVTGKTAYSVAGACVLALLVASPFRNLHNLNVCFRDPQGVMDIPAGEMRLEIHLLSLQMSLAILAVAGLVLGRQGSSLLRLAAAGAWSAVAVGGVLWDKWLGNFAGSAFPPHSIYSCLLDARSAHTHSILSNAPLVLAGFVAVWILWICLRARATSTDSGS